MNNNTVMKDFLRTAVNIEAYNEQGTITHTGTGFFYKIKLGTGIDYGKHVHICLVSNKHVLEKVTSISIYDNLNSFNKEEVPDNHKFTVQDVKDRIIIHENQDLAVINISDLMMNWIANDTQHTFKFIENDLIAHENELDILNSDIFMVGFPMSLQSEVSFKGVIYRGKLAFPPDMKFTYDDNYVLNMDGYSGNSGSPIFAIQPSVGQGYEIKLIGIQCSIYNPVTGYHETGEFRQHVSLTNAVKVKYLQELEPKIDAQWKRDFVDPKSLARIIEQIYDQGTQ